MDSQQKERYSRHLLLDEVGDAGQQKLINSKVLVVGAGGLGSPILQYLVAAGIGKIGIMDADVVSLTNLQRQVIYREDQIGKNKAGQAMESLCLLNSTVEIETYTSFLDETNAESIIAKYDVVAGATDNFESRLLIDAVTQKLEIPFVHGSIQEFQGQVSVFNYKGGPSYANLFPEIPVDAELPKGVIGYLPGVIGSLQAAEVIKIILGIGDILSGKLLVYDSLKATHTLLTFE